MEKKKNTENINWHFVNSFEVLAYKILYSLPMIHYLCLYVCNLTTIRISECIN